MTSPNPEPEAVVAAGPVRLRFIGDGRHYVIGVPADDIEVPADQAESLIATGLYALAEDGDKTPEGPAEASDAPTATEPSEAPTGE